MTGKGSGWWMENLLRPVMLAAMATCLAVPVVAMLESLLFPWDGSYFLVFLFIATLEGILSERVLQRQRITGWAYLFSRAAEVVTLLLVLKFANYIPLGLEALLAAARTWVSDPALFVSPIDLYIGSVFVLVWAGALWAGQLAAQLDVDSKESPPPDKESTAYYLWLTQPPALRDRGRILEHLAESIVWGGIALLIASALIFFLLPAVTVPTLATLIYFALGIALLTQARFSVVHTGWQIQGLTIEPEIARRWLLWATIFLVSVTLAALILPSGTPMGLVTFVYGLVLLLAQTIVFFFGLLMYILALGLSVFAPNSTPPEPPPLEFEPPTPLEPMPQPTGSPGWLDWVVAAGFWLAILGIVGYAVLRFIRDRLGLELGLGAAGRQWVHHLWIRLQIRLRGIFGQWRKWQRELRAQIRSRVTAPAGERLPPRLFRFVSLKSLPPRDLVRYFYLSIARRAAQAGLKRQPGQTPYEYEDLLDAELPDLADELKRLTEAFVQARYSPVDISAQDAQTAKPLWQRIKTALRQKHKGRRLPPTEDT